MAQLLTIQQARRIWNNADIKWTPQEGGQLNFFRCPYPEKLYEGERGCGKTAAIPMKFATHINQGWGKALRGIIFRRTYPELANLIEESNDLFNKFFPKAKYRESDHTWTFPEGEKLFLRYMYKPIDYWNYHGHQFTSINFDELSNWPTNECYNLMKSCWRSPVKGIPMEYNSTTNPWGPGRLWIKNRFIDPAPNLIPIKDSRGLLRCRIRGIMADNKIMLSAMPHYPDIIKAATLGDKEKQKAWLKGEWDIAVGAYFTDVWDKNIHIIDNFMPPSNWKCWRAFDWGSDSPFCVQWWAESNGESLPNGKIYPNGAAIMFHEWYGNNIAGGDPNKGLHMNNPDIGKKIRAIENEWKREYKIKILPGPADPSIYKNDGGVSIAAQIGDGLFISGDNNRLAGAQEIRTRLIGTKDKGPMMYVCERCRDFIRTFPELLRDTKNPDDVDTTMEDHSYDTARYFIMSRRHKPVNKVNTWEKFGW